MKKVPNSSYPSRVDRIESIADSKGVELDDVEVFEHEDDDVLTFRMYTKKAETEEDSVGIQVSVMTGGTMADMDFRNRIQNAISELKRSGSSTDEDDTERETEADNRELQDEKTEEPTNKRVRDRGEISSDEPELDLLELRRRRRQEIDDLEDRIEELEGRVETMEEYLDALEGLRSLIGANDNTEDGD